VCVSRIVKNHYTFFSLEIIKKNAISLRVLNDGRISKNNDNRRRTVIVFISEPRAITAVAEGAFIDRKLIYWFVAPIAA